MRLDPFSRRRLRELREAYDKINAALYVAEEDCARLRGENRTLADALARHPKWCGYNPAAPGDSVVNEPCVAAALGDQAWIGREDYERQLEWQRQAEEAGSNDV